MWRATDATGATGVQVDAKMGSNYWMACWRSKLRQFIRNKNPCDFWAQRKSCQERSESSVGWLAVLVATKNAGANSVKQVVSLGIPESRQSSFGWNQNIWQKWMKTNCAISQSYQKLWLTNQVANYMNQPLFRLLNQSSDPPGMHGMLGQSLGSSWGLVQEFRLTGWRLVKKPSDGGWVSTHLKNMRKSNWIISPSFGVKMFKKYLIIFESTTYRSRCQSVSSKCLRLIPIVSIRPKSSTFFYLNLPVFCFQKTGPRWRFKNFDKNPSQCQVVKPMPNMHNPFIPVLDPMTFVGSHDLCWIPEPSMGSFFGNRESLYWVYKPPLLGWWPSPIIHSFIHRCSDCSQKVCRNEPPLGVLPGMLAFSKTFCTSWKK